jgi:NAD(P)-dependent dehydrogenase (short-subunit alcohol dehydrogenase family)
MQKQTVLVTGAASGIGKACAIKLLDDGHELVALDLKEEALAAALPQDCERLVRIAGDVSRPECCTAAVEAVIARFGRLDALIHWAAIHSHTFWTELGAEEFNRVLATNVTGSFLMAQAAALRMKARGSGAIVLASSTSTLAGSVGGKSGSGGAAYVASKAAIIGLVRTLANSLGRDGIRVNAVAPGVVDTPMIGNYSPEHRAAQPGRVPLGRIGSPEEVAEVGCFLISEGARYINGETVIVNGGANFG